MKYFGLIFNCMFLAIIAYQVLYFAVQYFVLKRIELIYYCLFLLSIFTVYYFWGLLPILNNNFLYPKRALVTSALQMSFQFTGTFFYALFIIHYLSLHTVNKTIYAWWNFTKYYNLILSIVFSLLSFFNLNNQILAILTAVLSQPLNIAIVLLLWRIRKNIHSQVVLYSASFTTIGTIIFYILASNNVDTIKLYGGNEGVPMQIGFLLDIFILGYGLSLKAAESDKKLVTVLLENQQIVEIERSRLAKDLHDGLGGLLSGIKLKLHSISDDIPQKIELKFSKIVTQLDEVIKEMRRVAHNMMPEALLKFGLGEAIQDYCDGINESNIIKIKYTQIGSLQTLTQSTAIVLYRIIQELTNNSIKHASATNIFIQISKEKRGYNITVEDNGKGFDVKSMPGKKGTGLQNVQSRIEYLKGIFTIESEPLKGTSVNIEIPG